MKKNILISILMAAVLYDIPIFISGFVFGKCIGIFVITFISLLGIDNHCKRKAKTIDGLNRAIRATKGKAA